MITLRSAGLLTAAGVVFVGGSAVGYHLAFAPTSDTGSSTADCAVTKIKKGEKLSSTQVTVNLFNASKRAGLANDVGNDLESRGFITGQVGNNPTKLSANSVTIVTNNPDNPVVRIVARQFNNKITFARANQQMPNGVNVLLGQNFNALFAKAPTTIVADRDTQVCISPDDIN